MSDSDDQALPRRNTRGERQVAANAQVMATYLSDIARQRDAAAFEKVFRYFAPRVKAYMLKLGADDALAEELMQEAMVSVWRKADRFDSSKAAPSTWIFTIARNLRIDAYRKSSRPEPDPNDPAFQPDAEPQADDAISQIETATRLRDIIATLPDEQRRMLQLSYYQDKSHSEIAEDAGIPLGTVKSRLRLAMQKVRHALGEEER
ncbi:MAG: sigma-70 family RNA polymerase sigma factor [Pseudomonadota bacterium]